MDVFRVVIAGVVVCKRECCGATFKKKKKKEM